MADAVIGSLRVVLGLDTAAFTSGAKEAQGALGSFAKSFKTALAGLTIGAVAAEFTRSIRSIIDEADNLGKASQKFGVPVEQLSALKFAADLADVSFESLGKGLGKLSKALLDGAANPAGEAAKSFQALGVSVRDSSGNIKTSEQAFLDIADKFSKMEDGAAKTALAIRLFGRAGADLIPLLNQGRTGIKALTDEAKELGIVISADTAAKAEQFNDTLKRIKTIQDAVFLQIAESLLPALQKLADAFLTTARDGGGLQNFIGNLITETDIQKVQRLGVAFENLGRIFSAIKALPGDIISLGPTAALEKLDGVIVQNQKRLEELKRSFLSLGEAGAFESLDNLPTILGKISEGQIKVKESALATKSALESFLASQEKSIAATNATIAADGLAVGAKERLKIEYEALAIAQSNNIVITDAMRAKITEVANAAALAAEGLAKTQTQLNSMVKDAQDFGKTIDTFAVGSLNSMSSSFVDVITGSKSAAKAWEDFGKSVVKALAEILIKMLIVLPIATALKAALGGLGGGPLGFIGSFFGFSEGGSISIPKFQSGASFTVPGGMSSFDSQFVPMMLSPGERVDITPTSRADSGSRELIINPIKPKDLFTGETVREMVFALDQWMRDGGTGITIRAGT